MSSSSWTSVKLPLLSNAESRSYTIRLASKEKLGSALTLSRPYSLGSTGRTNNPKYAIISLATLVRSHI